MWRSRKRENCDIVVRIFAQRCEICLHLSSRASTELGARKPARRKAERRNSVAYSIRFTSAFKPVSTWIDFFPARWRCSQCRMNDCTECGWSPFYKAHGHSGFEVCKGRWLPVVATIGGRHIRRKGPRLAKRRNGEGAAITHRMCDSWPQHLLH